MCRLKEAGFTLVEILVVLAIVAVVSALAYNYITPLYASARLAYERDDLERQIRELPNRVLLNGHGGVLTSQSGDHLADGTIIAVEGAPKAGNSLEKWEVLRLDVPATWRLRVARPIFYHFSGTCEGGEVAFSSGSTTLRYVLTAPLCRPISADAKFAP
jgi:prepilin-type N-terminal cleavage/methylation domain-containing protein